MILPYLLHAHEFAFAIAERLLALLLQSIAFVVLLAFSFAFCRNVNHTKTKRFQRTHLSRFHQPVHQLPLALFLLHVRCSCARSQIVRQSTRQHMTPVAMAARAACSLRINLRRRTVFGQRKTLFEKLFVGRISAGNLGLFLHDCSSVSQR